MSQGKIPFVIRMMDVDGEYVGQIPLARAETLHAAGKLALNYNGRRTYCQALLRVDDFDYCHADAPAYHHHETHHGHTLVVIKRPTPDKSYGAKWDPPLTFAELRRGQIESDETKKIREAARADRFKNPRQAAAA